MQISEINYVNFRNLKDNNLKFSSKFNLFLGKNGQGKTSILEAIYFSATGKSFRTPRQNEIINYGRERSGSFVVFEDSVSEKSLSVKLGNGKKEYSYNKKRVKYDEFHSKLNIVSFIPEDISLLTGAPGVRRSFFDYEISQANNEYYQDLKNYTKLLKFRNKYLKEKKHNDPMFNIYQNEFIKFGARIIKKRLDYVRNISILLNLNYRKLFDDKKELRLKYSCFLGELKKVEVDQIENLIQEKINKVFWQEKKYGFSMVGPQKDDFLFLLNDKEAKSYASQGEKKSIVFSIKLSEIDMIIKEKKESPVFIIDDISSYFDSLRKESIIKYFKKRDIQLFISSTTDLDMASKNFYIEKGDIYEEYDQCKRDNRGSCDQK